MSSTTSPDYLNKNWHDNLLPLAYPRCAWFDEAARWVGELIKIFVEDVDLRQALHNQLLNLFHGNLLHAHDTGERVMISPHTWSLTNTFGGTLLDLYTKWLGPQNIVSNKNSNTRYNFLQAAGFKKKIVFSKIIILSLNEFLKRILKWTGTQSSACMTQTTANRLPPVSIHTRTEQSTKWTWT